MAPYRLDVVTLAPQAFAPMHELGVIGRAFGAGRAELVLHNPRDHATDRYRKVDDEPYGVERGWCLNLNRCLRRSNRFLLAGAGGADDAAGPSVAAIRSAALGH